MYHEREITALHNDWIRNVKTMNSLLLLSLKMTSLDEKMQSVFVVCCFYHGINQMLILCRYFYRFYFFIDEAKTNQWNNKTREAWGPQNKNANQCCKPCQESTLWIDWSFDSLSSNAKECDEAMLIGRKYLLMLSINAILFLLDYTCCRFNQWYQHV